MCDYKQIVRRDYPGYALVINGNGPVAVLQCQHQTTLVANVSHARKLAKQNCGPGCRSQEHRVEKLSQ